MLMFDEQEKNLANSESVILSDNRLLQLIRNETSKISTFKLIAMSPTQTVNHFLTEPNVDLDLAQSIIE